MTSSWDMYLSLHYAYTTISWLFKPTTMLFFTLSQQYILKYLYIHVHVTLIVRKIDGYSKPVVFYLTHDLQFAFHSSPYCIPVFPFQGSFWYGLSQSETTAILKLLVNHTLFVSTTYSQKNCWTRNIHCNGPIISGLITLHHSSCAQQ